MNADGSNQTSLSLSDSQRYQDDEPRWSPDGRTIVFISNRENNRYNIFVMDSNGNNQQNLTNNQDTEDFLPGWSPDGEQIVFYRYVITNPGYSDIYTMNRDGSNIQRITNDGQSQHQASDPAWYPGNNIVFVSNQEGGAKSVYSINPNGSNRQRISQAGSADKLNPCWSPDERYVAFAYGTGQIRIIRADGKGEEQVLTDGGRRNAVPSWGF